MIAGAENPSRPSPLFEALLPPGVATAELSGTGDPALLLAGERWLLGRADSGRIGQFAAGRLCARRAAGHFGVVDNPIGTLQDRRPHWPQSLTGSITHTDGFAAAAVGSRQRFRAIGIDVERIGSVSRDLWSRLLMPEEVDWLESLPPTLRGSLATLLFSAKGAFYKCQYEVTQQWLEFRDITLEQSGESFAVRPVGSIRFFDEGGGPAIVRFAFTRKLVLTAMTLAAH